MSEPLDRTLSDIRKAISSNCRKLLDHRLEDVKVLCLVNGEEMLVDDDPTSKLCNCLVLLALYSGATAVDIASKGRYTIASYPGSPVPIPDVIMPRYAGPRLILKLINMVDDRWVRNEALELKGTITYLWGPRQEMFDYTASVSISPGRDGVRAHITIELEGEADTMEGAASVSAGAPG
jgi:hypothetical protein